MSGDKHYKISYLDVVAQNDIPSLSKSASILIRKAIEQHLAIDPIGYGKPLRYSLKGHRRLRVSHDRVLYRIEADTVLIVAIKHRKTIYDC
ncbi:MAG: type II toxin-antitoxin system RelE/ParE family toxin [Bacteroidota bacterium]